MKPKARLMNTSSCFRTWGQENAKNKLSDEKFFYEKLTTNHLIHNYLILISVSALVGDYWTIFLEYTELRYHLTLWMLGCMSVCWSVCLFSARGESGHCELQSGRRGQDSQPPSQLHVCVTVTPSNTHTQSHDVKSSSVTIPSGSGGNWMTRVQTVLSVCRLCGWDEEQTVRFQGLGL